MNVICKQILCAIHVSAINHPKHISDLQSKMAGVLPRASSKDHPWRRHQFGKDYQCKDCGKVLSCYRSLKLHQLNIHNGLFPVSCPLCGKGLRCERDLRGHVASRHNMQKEFKCEVCGKEFGYNYTLKDHYLRMHNTVPS